MASAPQRLATPRILLDVEVGLGGRRRADGISLVGFAHVQRGAIHFGEDRDRGDAHLAAGANDAHRDLSAIGDQDFLEHERRESL